MLINLNEIIDFLNDDLEMNQLLERNTLYNAQKDKFRIIFTNIKNNFKKKLLNSNKITNSDSNNIIKLNDIYDLNDDEFYFTIIYED